MPGSDYKPINFGSYAVMTAETLVAVILEEKCGKVFCDWCLATRMRGQYGVQLEQDEVSRAAMTLAESGQFRRTNGRCSICREDGVTTSAR